MTSQEAIFIIQNYTINPCGYCHEGGDEVAEAFCMASDALKIVGNKLDSKSYLFDEQRYKNMPERIAETYRVLVGVCNTLNAKYGLYIHRYGLSKSSIDLSMAFILERAQATIMTLLEETGRLDEYDNWLKEQKEEKV